MAIELSVVIPAYDEEQRLGRTLPGLLDYLERRFGAGTDRRWEVLVVDDGSTDGTAEISRGFAHRGVSVLVQPENRGKGAAVRRGILASQGRRVLMTDADLSTPITELERLEPHLAEAGMVMGSRGLSTSRITVHQPFYREIMGKIFNRILRLLGVRGFRDTQCGFKLFDGEVARRLAAELTVAGYAFDVELVMLADQHGIRMVEVGVEWAHVPTSRVNPMVDSTRILWDVLRLRLGRGR